MLEETLKINPNQRDAKYQLGFVLFKEGKLKEAETLFQQVYAQTPPDMRGLLGLTEVYSSQGQFDRALKLLDEAMQKYPKALMLNVAWGNIAVRAGKTDEAITMFRTVLAADQKNFDIPYAPRRSVPQKGRPSSGDRRMEEGRRINAEPRSASLTARWHSIRSAGNPKRRRFICRF